MTARVLVFPGSEKKCSEDVPVVSGARLLQIVAPRFKDLSTIAGGVFCWNQFHTRSGGRDGYAVELNYRLTPISPPVWVQSKTEWPGIPEYWLSRIDSGQWFQMEIENEDGAALAEVILWQYSIHHFARLFCPSCFTATQPYLEEGTGAVLCDYCVSFDLWPGLQEAMKRGSWGHIRASRTILDPREREKARVLRETYSLTAISMGFFDRRPGLLLATQPRAFKVFNPKIQKTALGYFVADPRYMPLLSSTHVVVHEQ